MESDSYHNRQSNLDSLKSELLTIQFGDPNRLRLPDTSQTQLIPVSGLLIFATEKLGKCSCESTFKNYLSLNLYLTYIASFTIFIDSLPNSDEIYF